MYVSEGTTLNGKALISFKRGAFEPGEPVQVQLLKYQFVGQFQQRRRCLLFHLVLGITRGMEGLLLRVRHHHRES